jgi:hypothetical protein
LLDHRLTQSESARFDAFAIARATRRLRQHDSSYFESFDVLSAGLCR